MWRAVVLCLCACLGDCEIVNVITMEKDFSKVLKNNNLPKDVAEVVKRLNTFKIPVHPRIRLFYRLLGKSLAEHALRAADSLYVPNKYN